MSYLLFYFLYFLAYMHIEQMLIMLNALKPIKYKDKEKMAWWYLQADKNWTIGKKKKYPVCYKVHIYSATRSTEFVVRK